ncbi:hypothetical protein [Aeromonas media]|nr:hypothetical protein [Aeromonas media]MCE9925380.1 hypothetical protein [Aeromonas media]
MGMRVGMTVVMRVGMIMMMVVGVIMVVLVRVIMTLCHRGCLHPVVVVMDIPLMVVVVNDQGAWRTLIMGMMMIVLMVMFMMVLMIVFMIVIVGVCMVVILFMAGDPRLAASAYATHINLPRCR